MKISELTEAQKIDLEKRRDMMLEKARAEEERIRTKQGLNEGKRMAFELKKSEMEREIERRLEELKMKEKLTEEERLEIQRKEAELVRITEIRRTDMRNAQEQLEKISEYEASLLAQNEQLAKGHMKIEKELIKMEKDLDQPIVEVRVTEERMTTKTQEKDINDQNVNMTSFA